MPDSATHPGPFRTRRRRPLNLGLTTLFVLLVAILLLIVFWNWDWLLPMIDADASGSLGRKVTIQHLHVRLGRTTEIAATGITIASPNDFPASGDADRLAAIDALRIDVDVLAYLRHRLLTLTSIEIDHPVATIQQLPDGANNYTLHIKSGGGSPPQIGNLIINDGAATVRMAKYKTDMALTIDTQTAPQGGLIQGREIVVTAHGTYSGQPITGAFRGGALLSLRDPSNPYPVDLHLANGSTTVALVGTIEQPMTFGGAKLKLSLAGQDMSNLFALTGIPLPATPPYSITGKLNYTKDTIRFDDLIGRVGSSDLEGDLDESHPGAGRKLVTANVASRHVDLADLGGFLGATPGKTTTPGQDAATREKMAQANASPNLLPNTPFNLPKLNMANFEVHYKGEHIINRDVPLDNVLVWLSIENGRITLHPLNFAVGAGSIASNIDLNPVEGVLHTRADIEFRQLQLARLMAATDGFAGDGTVGGSAHLVATGNSVAEMLGHGDGGAQLFMSRGGDISALLVDLAGLQVGDAVLSALGIPHKTNLQCLVSDFTLTNGQLDTKAFLIATAEANILGSGTADLTNERLNLALSTQATHFSIGSLSTPINIHGTLKHPSVLPAPGPLAARAVPAVGLGVLFPPLALIPTIRLGLGDKNACADTLHSMYAGKPHNPS